MMTVHKLSAGDGYTYLTRQVASADVARGRGRDLSGYYVASGNPPGRWLGSGAAALGISGVVSEAQMRSLFGAGRHPDAEAMVTALTSAGASRAEAEAHARLGAAFPDYARLPAVVARVDQEVAAFREARGRAPEAGELAGIRARVVAGQRRAVAGYDLVFTPVKSVSLLWALGDAGTREAVEAAHHAAVADVLAWLEVHAAFTRIGRGGTFQVETHGLVCAAFDHRESRAGDPDLHTHVAVANKVRACLDRPDGSPRWLALDGRALYAVGVAASERYNTRIEDELRSRLPVAFEARPDSVRRDARPIRELAGVPADLVAAFSRRRADVEARYADLAGRYRAAHGRVPDRAARLRLAQQATLDTRAPKADPPPFSAQLDGWRARAEQRLSDGGVARMLARVLSRHGQPAVVPGPAVVAQVAASVVRVLQGERSTWSRWNLLAEVERQTRALPVSAPRARQALVDAVSAAAVGGRECVRIQPARLDVPAEVLRRSDGTPADVPHAAERYTTRAILDAELALLDAAREPTSHAVPAQLVTRAVAAMERQRGRVLDASQRDLARVFCTDPRRLVCAVGPAGAGKTTALRAACAAWEAAGRRVIPLAASAQAAQVLAADLGRRAENLHKYTHELTHPRAPSNAAGCGATDPSADGFFELEPGDVVLVDEAGLAGTLRLATLLEYARAAGAQVRLIGDPWQLGAVESGGAFRLLAGEVGAAELTGLHRFREPAEGAATLAVRAGNHDAVTHYDRAGRLHCGTREVMLEAAFAAWASDAAAGLTSLLVATSAAEVADLNARAHADRLATGHVAPGGARLRDGTTAGVGDWVLSRSNARALTCNGGRDFVKNGDRWTIQALHPDGSATVCHHGHHGRLRLPAGYLAEQVDLGYATTAARAQGVTVDTGHTLVGTSTTREALYVAVSRARERTSLYAITEDHDDTDTTGPEDVALHHDQARTGTEILQTALANAASEDAGLSVIRRSATAPPDRDWRQEAPTRGPSVGRALKRD